MAKVICVGLGPGDPELMSVKSDRLIRNADKVAYFRKAGRKGQARQIVSGMLADNVLELPMEYPVTTEIPVADPRYNEMLSAFYEEQACRLIDLAETSATDIIVLCEGDPFFYGSFMHLYIRLQGRVDMEIIPGITGMSGCWTATGVPMTWGDDILTVLMGTLPEETLTEKMQDTDAFVVMKTGRNLPKIKMALDKAGRMPDAWIVSHGTMAQQKVQRLVDFTEGSIPYFTIILVHGQGRRP
ncbi:precorrin-2 C(20)-methyltransferase [Sneathiella aquimaris]|jgi:precorrin-2/cobalt-factor-2 C20-methyltransferase|uniref:precorrin-2 C(20)-methyltransferase n=1 Tax=Sneathiella aquimaris TaxID=2599305 RepID=UPI00146EAFB5|nr:precorrin-2 C(20)-methyltransferase [Sneathiella aquimaris]